MMPHEVHPKLETIQRYCDGSLPDFEQVTLESHLAECEECLGVMSRMESLLESGFTAAAHAAALEAEARAADPLALAIRHATTTYRELADSLQDWLASAAALWGEAPIRHLGQVGLVPVSASAAAQPIRVTLLSGETRAMIEVRESGQTVEVASDALPPAVALLFATGEESLVRAAELQPEGNAHIARFEHIPAGSYRFAIGPPQRNSR